MGAIAFLHIPRTGGTTLHHYLRAAIGLEGFFNFDGDCPHLWPRSIAIRGIDDERRMVSRTGREDVSEMQIISGHFSYGLHDYLPAASYLTMLRHPLKRVASRYCYILNTPDDPDHEALWRGGFTLRDYVLHYGMKGTDNGMVRQLTGNMARPLGGVTTKDLARAKSILVNGMCAVGITELFSRSVEIIFSRLGLSPPTPSERKNATGGVPPDDLALAESHIMARNKLDLDLYLYAKKKFFGE